jgi:hypothetical protein
MSVRSATLVAVIVVSSVTLPRTMLAQYVDPGTSSLLWQLLLTGLAGSAFVLRSKIGLLVQRFRSRGARKVPLGDDSDIEAGADKIDTDR